MGAKEVTSPDGPDWTTRDPAGTAAFGTEMRRGFDATSGFPSLVRRLTEIPRPESLAKSPAREAGAEVWAIVTVAPAGRQLAGSTTTAPGSPGRLSATRWAVVPDGATIATEE